MTAQCSGCAKDVDLWKPVGELRVCLECLEEWAAILRREVERRLEEGVVVAAVKSSPGSWWMKAGQA